MIKTIYIYKSTCISPYQNIAKRDLFLRLLPSDSVLLYLWQNNRTIVIGRNQNVWKECKVRKFQQDGGYIIRRKHGGWAVYNDLGVLNYSLICPQEDFDVTRYENILSRTISRLGVEEAIQGPKALFVKKKRVADLALFYENGNASYQGTVRINSNLHRAAAYMNSPRTDLANLSQFSANINVLQFQSLLTHEFSLEFDLPAAIYIWKQKHDSELDELAATYKKGEWTLNQEQGFTFSLGKRFSWGETQLNFDCENSVISHCQIFTNAMDATFFIQLAASFAGVRMDYESLKAHLLSYPHDASKDSALQDILSLIEQSGI